MSTSEETRQFTEMVRQSYYDLALAKAEREEILLNIRQAELDGKITKEQADELRKQYQ